MPPTFSAVRTLLAVLAEEMADQAAQVGIVVDHQNRSGHNRLLGAPPRWRQSRETHHTERPARDLVNACQPMARPPRPGQTPANASADAIWPGRGWQHRASRWRRAANRCNAGLRTLSREALPDEENLYEDLGHRPPARGRVAAGIAAGPVAPACARRPNRRRRESPVRRTGTTATVGRAKTPSSKPPSRRARPPWTWIFPARRRPMRTQRCGLAWRKRGSAAASAQARR